MPNGKIQTEHVEVLKQVGEWLKTYGETIYGTRGGPLTARDWGVTTQKGNKVYVHVLSWHDESLIIPSWGKKVKAAKLFSDQSALKFIENEYGITIKVPKNKFDEVDTVIELELK
jgi:alpha-L-fucosidase